MTGDDSKAAKLARVLAFYAERLPVEERELMARLSVFPRGVTEELLGILVHAGGEVAGLLVNARGRLVGLLNNLKARGLVFDYRSEREVTWTAHPFLREKFRNLLVCPVEHVFEAVARSLSTGLEMQPKMGPTDVRSLDRYERLVEVTRLAGREEEAFGLFLEGMGGYAHLGVVLGEFHRGYRILASFRQTVRPDDFGRFANPIARRTFGNALALFAHRLGRLEEARAIHEVNLKNFDGGPALIVALRNASSVAFALGRLLESQALAVASVKVANSSNPLDEQSRGASMYRRAVAAHALGDINAARTDFAATMESRGMPVGPDLVSHHIDLGERDAARELLRSRSANIGAAVAASFEAVFARVNLADGTDPTPHLDSLRTWTARSGAMRQIIQAHLLFAQRFLSAGNLQTALGEAEIGLLHAVSCGYGLLRIELLIAVARIRLAWPDPPKAIQAAREALDLATHPDCQYAWGESDAAQVWGEAYFANHEPVLAHRAFSQALAVRKRIEHPGVAETERWLGIVP